MATGSRPRIFDARPVAPAGPSGMDPSWHPICWNNPMHRRFLRVS